MKKIEIVSSLNQLSYILISIVLLSCEQPNIEDTPIPISDESATNRMTSDQHNKPIKQKKLTVDFLPEGYVIFKKINGDLNNDGIEDCVIIIKGTDEKYIITDEYRGQLDRNRRGIIVLFNNYDYYELALSNYDCFSSENEDGGVYFAPDLSIDINEGNLIVQYGHGRYGYWKYIFRFQNSDFELIGYEHSENSGPIIERKTSINFLNKKKQVKVNTNKNADGGDEVFDETWENININERIRLSEIKNFDELNMSVY